MRRGGISLSQKTIWKRPSNRDTLANTAFETRGYHRMIMFPVPEYAKDVAIALLGSAVAIAGLLLVVAGMVFAQANSFPAETTDESLLARYETAGKLGLIPFLIALIEAAASLAWLVHRSDCLYTGIILGFFLLLVLTALYGLVLILRYL